MNKARFLLMFLAPGLVFLPARAGAQDWQIVWKDSMQTLKIDRDSIRANGSDVEYWYSDETDAIVDWMEHHYRVVSDCTNHRMRHLEVYDPVSGETKTVQDTGWKDLSYDENESMAVMHDEVCASYVNRTTL